MKTPTQIYIESLQTGHHPSPKERQDLCTALHAEMIDEPEMLWLDVNFEDMSDMLAKAEQCAATDKPTASDIAYLADIRRRDRNDREAVEHFREVAECDAS